MLTSDGEHEPLRAAMCGAPPQPRARAPPQPRARARSMDSRARWCALAHVCARARAGWRAVLGMAG